MTAAEKAETIDELCSQVEEKILRQMAAGGGVSTTKVYSKEELLAAMGVSEGAWKQMRATGLMATECGKKLFVSGKELARWVEENQK